jgi:hypothetical protein
MKKHYETHTILWRKIEIVQCVSKNAVSVLVDEIYEIWSLGGSSTWVFYIYIEQALSEV